MITINNLKKMKPYYNEKTNTYEFNDTVYFRFNLAIQAHINAYNIDAWNINAHDITAWNIDASNITARDIDAFNIKASNINARDIDAFDISFYAICSAREAFVCNSITSRRTNSKYFCLSSKVIIK